MSKSTGYISSSTSNGTAPSVGGGVTVPTGGGGVNPDPNIPALMPFDITPRQANVTVPINYTSTIGIRLFNSAILKLLEIFDGKSKSINIFNEKLAERERKSGWMEAGANIIMMPDYTGTPRNLIIEYGRLTVETI